MEPRDNQNSWVVDRWERKIDKEHVWSSSTLTSSYIEKYAKMNIQGRVKS